MAAPTLQAEGALAVVTSGNLAPVIPAHVADDILIVVTSAWHPNSAANMASPAAPAGWTRVVDVPHVGGTLQIDGITNVFWRRATASGTTISITRPAGWDTGTDGAWHGRAYVIRGCITTGTPWDDLQHNSIPYTSANQPVHALTCSGAERMAVHFYTNMAVQTVTIATGWTLGTSVTTTTGTDGAQRSIRKDNVSSNTSGDGMTVAAPATGGYLHIGFMFKPVPPPTVGQIEYRFRNDDGSETTATWMAALNTDVTVPLDTVFRLRIGLEAGIDNPPSTWYDLKYRVNGGAWQDFDASGAVVPAFSSDPGVVNSMATTQQFGSEGIFTAGAVDEGSGGVPSKDLNGGQQTEYEYVIEIPSGGLIVAGDVIEFACIPESANPQMVLTEIPAVTVGSGAIQHTIGQPSSTSTAQTVGRRKSRGAGVALEADSALAVQRRRSRALGQVSETDVAQPVVRRKTRTLGLVTETDSAQTIIRAMPLVGAVGQATATDTALSVSRRKTRAVGQALESDLAQPVARVSRQTVGLVTEADVAQAVGRRKTRTLGQALESDAAQPVARRKNRSVGQATETDLAQAVGRTSRLAVGLVTEGDTAQAVGRQKRVTLGLVSETSTAQAVSSSSVKNVAVGQATETDAALSVLRRKTKLTTTATEASTAQAVGRRKTRTLGLATAGPTAQPIGRRKSRTLGLSSETNTAQVIVASTPITGAVGQASTSHTAQPVARVKRQMLGIALETSTAQPVTVTEISYTAVGQALESSIATSTGRRKQRTLGAAIESNTALAAVRTKRYTLGQATTVEVAMNFYIGSGKIYVNPRVTKISGAAAAAISESGGPHSQIRQKSPRATVREVGP